MKRILIVVALLLCNSIVMSQAFGPMDLNLDESRLALSAGTATINDVTAEGGKCIYRPANSTNGTIWFRPYTTLQAGNYIIQCRLKVNSNISSAYVCSIDITSLTGEMPYTAVAISPSIFRKANEWQVISMPVQISANANNIEIRGINFTPGTCDLYLDYINIVSRDFRGFYSDEYTVTPIGNVGIGTKSPAEKLAVNGNIRTQKIIVTQTGWPDYVFDSSYQLPSLESVSSFIKENKYLPEMPSATAIEEDGHDLGEMQRLLLKKVEGLTLY